MNEIGIMIVDDKSDGVVLKHGGYSVERGGKTLREFECLDCRLTAAPWCDHVHEALDYARRVGPGAQVMRGGKVLAFVTRRTYGETIAGAERANAKAAAS